MKLSYTDRAKQDIELATLWYEEQRKGLGFEFLDCIKQAETLIKTQPQMYAFVYSIYRCGIVKRFPFSVFYTIENNEEIIVHSVFDNCQNPDKKP